MKHIMLCMLLLVGLQLTAQDEKAPLKYSFGYFGEYAYHPGLTLAVDYTLKQKTHTRIKRGDRGTKIWTRSIILRGELLGFNHPDNSTIVSIIPQAHFRKTKEKGFYYEAGIGFGYLRTQYAAPILELEDNGSTIEYSGGQNATATTLGIGIGKDNWLAAQKNLGWFARTGVLYQAPYNDSLAARIFISAGVNYTFANNENK